MPQYDLYGNPIPGADQMSSADGQPPPDGQQPPPDPAALAAILAGQQPSQAWPQQPSDFAGPQTPPDITQLNNFASAIKPNYADIQPHQRQKTPPLALALAGITEALSAASHMRKGPHMQYRLMGRHGEKYMSGGRAQAPQSQAPPVGSTMMGLMAQPGMQQRAEQQRLAPVNAARQGAYAKAVSDFAAHQMLQKTAPPPPVHPLLAGYNAAKQIEQSGAPGSENLSANYLRHATNPTPQTKQTLDEQYASLKAQGKTQEAATLKQSIKDLADARRGPQRPSTAQSPADKADAASAAAINRQRDQSHTETLNTFRQRLNDTQAEIHQLEAQIAAAAQEAATTPGAPPADPALAKRLRLKRQLAAVLDRQIGQGGPARAPEWGSAGSPDDGSGENGTVEYGLPMDATGDGGDMGAAMPAGADMADVTLPDGSHSTEWTEEDWATLRAHDPATYDQYAAAVAGSAE